MARIEFTINGESYAADMPRDLYNAIAAVAAADGGNLDRLTARQVAEIEQWGNRNATPENRTYPGPAVYTTTWDEVNRGFNAPWQVGSAPYEYDFYESDGSDFAPYEDRSQLTVDAGPAAVHLSTDEARGAYAAAGDLAARGDARDDDLEWPDDWNWGRPAPMLGDTHNPVYAEGTMPDVSDEDPCGCPMCVVFGMSAEVVVAWYAMAEAARRVIEGSNSGEPTGLYRGISPIAHVAMVTDAEYARTIATPNVPAAWARVDTAPDAHR